MKWGLVAAAALVASALSASADAAVLYSLAGTVGDSNWHSAGPAGVYELDSYLTLPTPPPSPGFSGSFGMFSTTPVQYYFKFTTSANLTYIFAYDDFTLDDGEYVIGPSSGGYSYYGGGGIDGGGGVSTTDTLHSSSFQVSGSSTSQYIDRGYVTGYAFPCCDTLYTGELVDYETITGVRDAGWTIQVAGKGGEPFSLVFLSSIPEPDAWSLMIGGFAAIGAARRSARRRSVAA